MKTHPSLKKSFLLVFQHPLVSAILAIFLLTVITLAILAVYHPIDHYGLISKIAAWSFGVIAFLGLVHLIITRVYVTRFSARKNRIQLIYYGGRPEIYQEPVFKKLPYAEIIFPDNWDLANHYSTHFSAVLSLGLESADRDEFHLFFGLHLEISGNFQAKDLENLISYQKKRSPWRTRFEFLDCLEDILIKACCAHHASLKLLLEQYQFQELRFADLEARVLEFVKIPELFSNIEKMELRLNRVTKVTMLSPSLSSLKKVAAVL